MTCPIIESACYLGIVFDDYLVASVGGDEDFFHYDLTPAAAKKRVAAFCFSKVLVPAYGSN
jgi:hypothetical protein